MKRLAKALVASMGALAVLALTNFVYMCDAVALKFQAGDSSGALAMGYLAENILIVVCVLLLVLGGIYWRYSR